MHTLLRMRTVVIDHEILSIYRHFHVKIHVYNTVPQKLFNGYIMYLKLYECEM